MKAVVPFAAPARTFSVPYAALCPSAQRGVCEPDGCYQTGFHWTERHLQCVWFDDRLRPSRLLTTEGEQVHVESPGRWNLEAGPDFLDAALLIGSERRRVVGDVEIHVRPLDWERHRHNREGLYRHVALHVTYFATPPLAHPIACGILQLPLTDALTAMPAFCFDDIDVAAYPHATLPLTPRPCELALRDTHERWRPLLATAGRHRIEIKAQRLRTRLARIQDREQLLYEEVMAALGYKHNAATFRRLAQFVPLCAWAADTTREQSYARLLGTAGWLPDVDLAVDEETCRFVRSLWDHWWRNPTPTFEDGPLALIRHATRPANAPTRRLATAAALFHGGPRLAAALLAVPRNPPARWFAHVADLLNVRLGWGYWQWHLTMTSARQLFPTALVGKQRMAAIVANVVLPLLATEGDFPAELARNLPPEDLSAPMREAANVLFSRDHNPALYAAAGLEQQGLLQIHHDFCLNARTGCGHCALAEELAQPY